MKKQHGFTLIEYSVCLLLSSMMAAILLQCYIGFKQAYLKSQKKLDNVLEVAWLSTQLKEAIQNAGFTPCQGLEQLITFDQRSKRHLSMMTFKNGSNAFLQLNRMHEPIELVSMLDQNTLVLSEALNAQRPVIIADCKHAEVHNIDHINQKNIILKTPLKYAYTKPTYVGEWLEEKWFMKNKKGLYYLSVHTEALSGLIQKLQTKVAQLNKKRQIKLTLVWEKNNTKIIKANLRNS